MVPEVRCNKVLRYTIIGTFLFSWGKISPYRIYGFTSNECVKETHNSTESKNRTYNLPSRKRCKTGSKLLLLTCRKSHTGFQLVPKLVTLNDPERRNGRYFAFISPNSEAFGANYTTVRLTLSAIKMKPKEFTFWQYMNHGNIVTRLPRNSALKRVKQSWLNHNNHSNVQFLNPHDSIQIFNKIHDSVSLYILSRAANEIICIQPDNQHTDTTIQWRWLCSLFTVAAYTQSHRQLIALVHLETARTYDTLR